MKKLILILMLIAIPLYSQSVSPQLDSAIQKSYIGSACLYAGSQDHIYGGGLCVRYKFIGFDISSSGKSDDLPEYLDYSIPHTDYSLKEYQRGTVSMLLDLYLDIDAFKDYMPFIGVGYYSQDNKILAYSNATGLYYKYADKEKKSGIAYKFGFQGGYKWFALGIGYHNIVGPFMQLGLRF